MRRLAISLDAIADRSNLMLAVTRAARGKRHRPSVRRFLGWLDRELNVFAREILSEASPRGRFRTFTIRDPKLRVITAACFADRVLHHAILNIAEPRFERMLVPSTFACRPDKGVHRAVLAVQTHLRRWPWLVQIDIDQYFPSIAHDRLVALLRTRFKGKGFLRLVSRILASGSPATPGRGLPIGSLTSQHFANAYLDGADRFLLEHEAVRGHVRYMDDIVWWCASREGAARSLQELQAYLAAEWSLSVKPTTHLGPSERGVAFCGFRIRPGVILPSSRKMSKYRAACEAIARATAEQSEPELSLQRRSDQALAVLHGTTSERFRAAVHQQAFEGLE